MFYKENLSNGKGMYKRFTLDITAETILYPNMSKCKSKLHLNKLSFVRKNKNDVVV